MKLFVVLSVVVVGAFAKTRIEAVQNCIKDTGIDARRIGSIMCDGPKNKTEDCFVDCSLKEMDMIYQDGKLNVENAKREVLERKGVPKEHIEEAVKLLEACSSVACSGECQCGPAILKCLTADFDKKVCLMVFGP